MRVDKETFFKLQSEFEYVPYNQTEEWLESFYKNSTVVYYVNDIRRPLICCWGIVHNRPIIKRHLRIEGASINGKLSSDLVRDFYKYILSEGFDLVEVSDLNIYNIDYEIGIRRAGYIRPLGLSLSPLSMILRLNEPFNFHRNWRRNVKLSKEQGIRFLYLDNLSVNHAKEFIKLFFELKMRKKLRFTLSLDIIMKLINNGRYKLFFVLDKGNNHLAGRIVYVHRKNAYDVFAANSSRALAYGAVYYLQEEILNFLKNQGVDVFDYGRISPSSDSRDNVYLSKCYSGGYPILYNGEWQYAKYKFYYYIKSISLFCLRNKELY